MTVPFFDLNEAGPGKKTFNCEVCVIGAGAAGLYLANRLAAKGVQTVILEAGNKLCGDGKSVGIEPLLSGDGYLAATEGRSFGWGGTTSRWGGLLFPYSKNDLREGGSREEQAWEPIVERVLERSGKVLDALGLDSNPDFFDFPEKRKPKEFSGLFKTGLVMASSEFLSFRRRNLTYLVEEGTGTVRNLSVHLNAVAARWEMVPGGPHGTVRSITAVSAAGGELAVSAKFFVIAAGTIETTRILLEMEKSTPGGVLPKTAALGKGLSDHLSCPIAQVPENDRPAAIQMFGPRFANGRMRSFRFLDIARDSRVPRYFAHFLFLNSNPGFQLAKKFLFNVQKKKMSGITLKEIAGGLGGLFSLAIHRYFGSALYIPKTSPVILQLDVEQAADPQNRITLSGEKDPYGRFKPVLQWKIQERDRLNIQELAERIFEKWPGSSLGFPSLEPLPLEPSQLRPHDTYHPVGTCRMGSDPEAVVDLNLRVRGTDNLTVLSTGLFSSAGTANPTFSMLCLGDWLAENLAKELGR